MTSEQRRQRLLELMEDHSLTATDVASILPGTEPRTVIVWRCRTGRNIPVIKLELLELKLERAA